MKKTYIAPAASVTELVARENMLAGSPTGNQLQINDEEAGAGYSQWTQKKGGGFWTDDEAAE